MIDIQGLLKVLHAAEEEPNFDMSYWVILNNICGTTHCMIGAFCNKHQEDELTLLQDQPVLASWSLSKQRTGDSMEAIAVRFGITTKEAKWLFAQHPFYVYKDGNRYKITNHRTTDLCKHAVDLTKPEALARLRKFIYYKLHKQEMIVEEPQRNKPITLPRKIAGRSSAILAQYA